MKSEGDGKEYLGNLEVLMVCSKQMEKEMIKKDLNEASMSES